MNKFLFICGSRGEWGYIYPLIKLLKKNKIAYEVVTTNMLHLSSKGNLFSKIKNKKINFSYKSLMSLEGDNLYSMSKSLGVFYLSISDFIFSYKPSWIIIAGDRGEQFMAAIAGAYTYIPVAHIQAGERSGNIDGVIRHAIAKVSHIHFASNQDSYNRLLKSGEQKYRIFNTGAPQLDELRELKDININKFLNNFSLEYKKYCIVLFHAVTEEFAETENQINELIKFLNNLNEKIIWILPNNDAGSQIISDKIALLAKNKIFKHSNIERNVYLNLLKFSSFLIGNSSSGIIEAPFFKIPVINIGNRQKFRMQSKNVVNCNNKYISISKAYKKIMDKQFRKKIESSKSVYGDGKSSKKILSILLNTKIDDKLLNKEITF